MHRTFERRAARARALVERFPEAGAALEFYAAVAEFQAAAPADDLEGLVMLVRERGPDVLKREATGMDREAWRRAVASYRSGEDRGSPRSFFARALLQIAPVRLEAGSADASCCPRCGSPPQVGALREEGHGTALSLVCSLCFEAWGWTRGRCPSCGEAKEDGLAVFEVEGVAHLQIRACESCRRYVLVVRRDVEPEAIPEVDEIAGLALDVWARERGFTKIQPNLVGM